MVTSSESCHSLPTNAPQICSYDEYYRGDRDKDNRRNGNGENHWTGAESIEWYIGHFVHDTMNGYGDYRWRYRGVEGDFVTYEGHLLANQLHGYGTMSYPDGRVFTGLFHNNVRWGPGVESHACVQENVGFWRGTQLIRLAWKPAGPNVALDFSPVSNGRPFVEQFRIMLASNTKIIGETNSALELLKQAGSMPLQASENWPKLYTKHCTDLESKACHVDVFENDYYNGEIEFLEEITSIPENESQDTNEFRDTFFAWNNNEIMLHMMKHCYKHEDQRNIAGVNLPRILNGPRKRYRPAGKHELDCRTLLMASYLGDIANVAKLINECYVHPDLADIQGNTSVMYAACGDQPGVIHFLVEAGANVNSYNDSCCTPLGVALMRLVCAQKNIAPNVMVQALLPPPVPIAPDQRTEQRVFDWYINRELPVQDIINKLSKSLSKTARAMSARKIKSSASLGSILKKKTESIVSKPLEHEYESDDSLTDERKVFTVTNQEYISRVTALFSGVNMPAPYIFSVNNMIEEVAANPITSKTAMDSKKTVVSKVFKDPVKPSKEIMWQNNEKDSLDSNDKIKVDATSQMVLTILQLLADGADPKLVVCPQPAMFLAVMSGLPDLVQHLVQYGADINESFLEAFNYTALDVAISGPLSTDNVELIRSLLDSGADASHRLQHPDIPGPTLLHAILARKTESNFEQEIVRQIIELLLEYNCNPGTQFNGRSAIDLAMNKDLDLLNIFIKSSNTNLNEVINSDNQTILVKMFSSQYFKRTTGMDRITILTNLLLYGADPLIECHDGKDSYGNIFAYAKKVLADMDKGKPTTDKSANSKSKAKLDTKSKNDVKGKKEESSKIQAKPTGKLDEVTDYKQVVELVTECARLLHIRWEQAQLMKELIAIINKYKHRQWNMILKEHTRSNSVGLWLTPQRCLEIWNILKRTKKKIYRDDHILKHLLCIVQFYNRRSKVYPLNSILTSSEKSMIETDVGHLINEHNIASKLAAEAGAWNKLYVKPELAVRAEEKYKICYECAQPLEEETKILCKWCNIFSFCSYQCIRHHINRISSHPCIEYMKEEYAIIPESP